MNPKLVVLQSQTKLQVLEKKNPAYLHREDLQNSMQKFFKNKWVSRYLNFFSSEKLFFNTKFLIKIDRQKIKKIPHTVLETIISQIIS